MKTYRYRILGQIDVKHKFWITSSIGQISHGKPKKAALVACMRKLLTILNSMIKYDQLWRYEAVKPA